MAKQRKLETFQAVWVGYVDGRPHAYSCEIDGAGCVAVYTSKKEARKHYQDVRKSILKLQDDTVGDRQ